MRSITSKSSSVARAVYYVEEYMANIDRGSHTARYTVSASSRTEASDRLVVASSASRKAEAGMVADISHSSEVERYSESDTGSSTGTAS